MGKTITSERQRVRVWFGQQPMVDRTTTPEAAAEFAQAMDRRFAGLPITIEAAACTAKLSSLATVADGNYRQGKGTS